MGFNVKHIESVLAYFSNEVALVIKQVVCAEPITGFTFCVTIIFVKPCGHVGARKEVTAINIFKLLNLPAGYTSNISIWHSISQSNIDGEYSI